MLKVRKRVIKTSLAVIICLSIYLLLMLIEKLCNLNPNTNPYTPTNWYTPFFAGIATIYALQRNSKDSINQAKIRSIGSIIGGLFGALVIWIFELIYLKATGANDIHSFDDDIIYRLLQFSVTSLGILILIPLTVRLKKQNAVFITCLTYLSVTVSIRNGGMEVWQFAANRILSTIIGVLISLYINTFPHFRTRNNDILFMLSIDNSLIDDNHKISPYTAYKIEDLLLKQCNLSLMTTRALTSVHRTLSSVNVNTPTIIMNGASIFYPEINNYESLNSISRVDKVELLKIFNSRNLDIFTYLINRGVLCAYYNHLENEGSKSYFESRKSDIYYSFTEAIPPLTLDVSQYVLVNKTEIINEVIEEIKKTKIADRINVVSYPYKAIEGYSFLKVNSKSVSKLSAIERIKENNNCNYVVCVGSGKTDLEAMDKADYSICLNNAPEYVKEHADYILPSEKVDQLFTYIDKIFNTKDYKLKYHKKSLKD